MTINEQVNQREYAVIVKNYDDLNSIYADLENHGTGVNQCCPSRAVKCSSRKPLSRVTDYNLSSEEAELLRKDPRVEYVGLSFKEKNIKVKLCDIFSKKPTTSNHKNWGLLYSSVGSHHYPDGSDVFTWRGYPTDHTNIDATITSDKLGEGVDIVIIDQGVRYDHPEFAVNADGTGGTRFIKYNWFQHDLEVLGYQTDRVYNYDPYDGLDYAGNHGTHVAGTAAGNTQGWAKKANIYNINIFSQNPNNNIDDIDIFNYVKAFHLSKNGSRPTVVNCSFVYVEEQALKYTCKALWANSKNWAPQCGGTCDVCCKENYVGTSAENYVYNTNQSYLQKEILSIDYQGVNYPGRYTVDIEFEPR